MIRHARPEDLPAIRRIVIRAYTPHAKRMGQTPGPMRDDYAVRIENGQIWVVERDQIPVGLIVLIPGKTDMLLDNVAVCPSQQGAGLGKRLLAFADRYTLLQGLNQIRLYTHVSMVENHRLYMAYGYQPTHRAREHGLERIYFAKDLTSCDN